jgi:hypothetical protein
VALLLSVMVIGIRTPRYIRGKYLERELELARRVQNDLQPKPLLVSPSVDFASSAQAADHVGGDSTTFSRLRPASPGHLGADMKRLGAFVLAAIVALNAQAQSALSAFELSPARQWHAGRTDYYQLLLVVPFRLHCIGIHRHFHHQVEECLALV